MLRRKDAAKLSMVYADTDFFLALLKESDWLKASAEKLLEQYRGNLWISPATLIELLLVVGDYGLDPKKLLVDAINLAELRYAQPEPYLLAAHLISKEKIRVFDALHAAFCRKDKIISSDKVFDRLGLKRIRLASS